MPIQVVMHENGIKGSLGYFRAFSRNTNAMVANTFETIGPIVVAAVRRVTPMGATGNLIESTTFRRVGQRLFIEQRASNRRGGFYGRYVRGGTPPHYVWPQDLMGWTLVKFGSEKAAYALAKSIARKGTQANPYHARAFTNVRKQIRPILNKDVHQYLLNIEQYR